MSTPSFPYRDTQAAIMLGDGLRRLRTQKKISQRELAKRLGYKQSVVFSHMASGRARIPLEHAELFAKELGLDKVAFLRAVLEQRLPETDWSAILAPTSSNTVVQSLEEIAARPLESFNQEQLSVMREVAADVHPRRRWLSIHELAAVEFIRRARPEVVSAGLSTQDYDLIERALF